MTTSGTVNSGRVRIVCSALFVLYAVTIAAFFVLNQRAQVSRSQSSEDMNATELRTLGEKASKAHPFGHLLAPYDFESLEHAHTASDAELVENAGGYGDPGLDMPILVLSYYRQLKESTWLLMGLFAGGILALLLAWFGRIIPAAVLSFGCALTPIFSVAFDAIVLSGYLFIGGLALILAEKGLPIPPREKTADSSRTVKQRAARLVFTLGCGALLAFVLSPIVERIVGEAAARGAVFFATWAPFFLLAMADGLVDWLRKPSS